MGCADRWAIDAGRDRAVWLRRGGFRYVSVDCDTGRTDR